MRCRRVRRSSTWRRWRSHRGCCRHRNCKPKRPDPEHGPCSAGTAASSIRRATSSTISSASTRPRSRCRISTSRLPRAEDDAAAELIKDKGMEHEKAVLAAFKAQGLRIAEFPEQGDPAALMDAALGRDARRRRRDLPRYAHGGALLRPHGLPAASGAAVEPRRAQLRGRRHQARAQRQGQVRGPARVATPTFSRARRGCRRTTCT